MSFLDPGPRVKLSFLLRNLDTKETHPCYPSPCGPNTLCEKVGSTAVCKCLPGLQGVPTSVTGCYPECVLSSDCPGDKACIQNKCRDPCSQNVCGSKAVCKTINHSPLCSCPSPLIGNPFEECYTKIGKHEDKFECTALYHILSACCLTRDAPFRSRNQSLQPVTLQLQWRVQSEERRRDLHLSRVRH